jgi:hypothetical protein
MNQSKLISTTAQIGNTHTMKAQPITEQGTKNYNICRMLTKFDQFCRDRNIAGKDIDKAARQFWTFQMAKGREYCPFPEYLTKFAKGQWCPFETGYIPFT